MQRSRLSLRFFCQLTGVLLCHCLSAAAGAQTLGGGVADQNSPLGANKAVLGEGDRVPKLEAGFTTPAADGSSQLFIVVTLPSGAHTYSVTQPEGGPIRTQIEVTHLDAAPTIGKFQPVVWPKIVTNKDEFDVPQEEHFETVKWVATVQLAAGVKPETVKLEGKVKMQLCDATGCLAPKDYPFTASLTANAKPEKPAEPPSKAGKTSQAAPRN
jgi:hypothetical protein